MVTQLLELAIVAWVPGAIFFRLPIGSRERRAALDPEERVFWAILFSVTVSLGATLILAVAGRYTFRRLVIFDLIVAAAAAVLSRFNLRLGPTARRIGPSALIPLALVVLGIWRFFPPAEYVIGGRDPGTYVNEGIQIAQRGTVVYHDPVVASVPAAARDLFFPSHQRDDYYSTRFMGFFIRNPDTGAVVGQFPHLFPASIAIGYGIDGLTGARRTTGVWAILGLLAVYFTGARLLGPAAAGAAAVLLALHVVQVWFGRYPNAEIVMQALVFAAMLAVARSHADGDAFFAPLAGVLLGLLIFLRFDAVLAIAGVVCGLVLFRAAGGRARASFAIALGIVLVLALVYLFGPLRAYMYLPVVFLSNFRTSQYALVALGALMLVVTSIVGVRSPSVSRHVRTAMPMAFATALAAAAVYALWFRQPTGGLAARDAFAVRTFADFYLTLPGLLAALVGYALVARRSFWKAPELFVTVAMFAFFFFYKIRITSDHFWMARRFLPVILPAALLFAAAAALAGSRIGTPRARLVRTALGAVFLTLLAAQYARASRPILGHVEYAGIIPRIEHLASTIHDDDLVVVESRDASDTHVLALPLAYIYARNVLVLASRLPDKPAFAAFLDWAQTRYRRVLFIGGGGTDLLSKRWAVTPLASERFQVPEYDAPRDAYPRTVRQKEFDYTLYEFTPPLENDGEFDLDVGVRDDLHVLRFHAKEITEGRTFRWSRDTSYVSITALHSTSHEVALWMSDGGRPPGAPAADVTASLAGERLGTVRVVTGFRPYTFAIPAALAQRAAATGEPVQLKIDTPVWSPEKLLGTPDSRDLGVMVDRVAVR